MSGRDTAGNPPRTPPAGYRPRFTLGLGVLALTAASAGALAASGRAGGTADSQTSAVLQARQAEVAGRGAAVMPFDLDRTRHVFTKLSDGGEQTVTALDPTDATQIRLIREHLQQEAVNFASGKFTDPAAIHGSEMPGLDELRAAGKGLKVAYTPLAHGAALRYTGTDPRLVEAIHTWFTAQSTDHGTHPA